MGASAGIALCRILLWSGLVVSARILRPGPLHADGRRRVSWGEPQLAAEPVGRYHREGAPGRA